MASLLVEDELARAIRHESAQALCYWWGVSSRIVWRWRRSLGVARMDSEGSVRLILAAYQRGAERVRGKPVPARLCALRRRIAVEKGCAANFASCWTEEEVALLGADSDQAVATRLGRTRDKVRLKRTWMRIDAFVPSRAVG
jgi:hypothetical protein